MYLRIRLAVLKKASYVRSQIQEGNRGTCGLDDGGFLQEQDILLYCS